MCVCGGGRVVKCGCFGNMYTVFTVFFYIVSFMYIYSCLFCLYSCKDYCHRVTIQLQLIIIIIILEFGDVALTKRAL